MMWESLLALLLLGASLSLASPISLSNSLSLLPRAAVPIDEYIALGDSYATGVGAGNPDQSVFFSRCLRYNLAYPRIMEHDARMPGDKNKDKLTNNACSGQKAQKILDTQFNDEKSGEFKTFGKPQYATISAGGDDIEFKDLVLSCIYEFPTKPRKCQDQIKRSKDLIQGSENDLVGKLDKLISKALEKGKAAHGNSFRVYFLGYAQFFNTAPPKNPNTPDYCSQQTWSKGKPWQTGLEKLKVAIKLREQLNEVSRLLNGKIGEAVGKHSTDEAKVYFVDWGSQAQGHRYCEEGVEEPKNDDDNIWFFQWLDKDSTNDNDVEAFHDKVAQKFFQIQTAKELSSKMADGTITGITTDQFLEKEVEAANENTALAAKIGIQGAITNRVKVFHPKAVLHQKVADQLFTHIQQDFGDQSNSGASGGRTQCKTLNDCPADSCNGKRTRACSGSGGGPMYCGCTGA